MSIVNKIGAIFDGVIDTAAALSGILIIFLMLSVCAEIFMRYFAGVTTVWVLETNEYALLYITFLGTAWVLKRGGHVAMDILVTRLNRSTQLLVNISTSFIGATACFIITWFGARVVWEYLDTGRMLVNGLTVPAAPIFVVIPLGFFLLSVQFLRRAHGYFRSLGNVSK